MTTQAGRPQSPAAAGQARAGHGAPGRAAARGRPATAGTAGHSTGPGGAPRPEPAPAGAPGATGTWPARPRPGRLLQPPGPADDTPQRWSAQLARTTGPIPQTYYDLAFGDGRLQVMLTEAPAAGQGRAGPAGSGTSSSSPARTPGSRARCLAARGPRQYRPVRAGAADPRRRRPAGGRDPAGGRRPGRRDPRGRRTGSRPDQSSRPPPRSAPIREGAEREAAEIKQQAAAQVAAIREAAEREIAELRATVLALSDELRGWPRTSRKISPARSACRVPAPAGWPAHPRHPCSAAVRGGRQAVSRGRGRRPAGASRPGPARAASPPGQASPPSEASPWLARPPAEDRRPGDQGASAQRHAPDGGRHGRADHHRDPVRGR